MIELSVVIAVITGVGQAVKQFVPSSIMPLISLVIGVAAGFGFVDGSIPEQIVVGLGMGLAASGLFDVAELPMKKVKNDKKRLTK